MRSVAVVLVCLLSAIACEAAGPARSATPTETPITGGRLVIGRTGDLMGIQPAIHGPQPITSLIYESFVQLDPASGQVVQGFGSVSRSRDGLRFTVEIDPRAVWSDGRPLVAADWVTALKAIARTRTSGDWLSEFSEITEIAGYQEYAAGRSPEITGITSEGGRLVVTMGRVLCKAITMFATVPPLPTHVFGRYVADGGEGIAVAPENLTAPVSSGPFVLKEWRRGDQMTLARNGRYWRGPPLLDEIVSKTVSPGAVADQLANGLIGLIGIAPAAVSAVEQMRSVRIQRFTPPAFTFLGWNGRSESAQALRDVRVRQALTHALDMDMATRILAPHGTRVHSPFTPWGWASASAPARGYDLDRANALLGSAGYVKGARGRFEKDGDALRFTLTTTAGRGAFAQFVVDQYAAFGVEVVPRIETFDAMVASAVAGRAEGFVLSYTLHPDPDQRGIWHSAGIPAGGSLSAGTLNIARLANAELDSVLDQAGSPPGGDCSQTARAAHYVVAARIIHDEQPLHFAWTEDHFTAHSAQLRGYRIGPHSFRFFHLDAHRWWLSPEQK